MARRQVVISDFTGKVIEDSDQVAQVRVLDHPLIERPVKLDAFVLEMANIKDSNRELVTIEVVNPGEAPERHVIELADFDKLIKAGSPDDVLNGAESYYEGGAEAPPRRRGRPAGSSNKASSTKPKRDPAQLQAIREWARENGHQVSDRGRISATIEQAYEDAHK